VSGWVIVITIDLFKVVLLGLASSNIFFSIKLVLIREVRAAEDNTSQKAREAGVRLLVEDCPVLIVVSEVAGSQVILQNYNSREDHTEGK